MSAWGHTKVNSKGTQVPPEMQEVPARVPGRGAPGCSGEGAHRVERLFDSVVNGPPVRGPLPRIPHHVVQAVSIGGEGIDLRAQKGSCCHSLASRGKSLWCRNALRRVASTSVIPTVKIQFGQCKN